MEKKRHESNKLKEYESIISSQKEHINRYENRLKGMLLLKHRSKPYVL